MARVFLSYDREDATRAKGIALALEREGHSVWWDRQIKAGSQYSREIEQALNAADAVVVLWSARSIDSPWVRDEAAAGRDRNRLVPVLIETCDPPLGFRQFQNIDLSRWKVRGRPPELVQLLDAIPRHEGTEQRPAEPRATEARPYRMKLVWLAFFTIVIVAVAFVAFRFLQSARSDGLPVVAVVPAEDSSTAREWARDVLVALGGLEGAARPFQLVDEAQGADLLIEVTGQAQEASIVLRGAKDRSLLWSRDIQRPQASRTDLQRQVSNSAALILRCAHDGLSADDSLNAEAFKIYLEGCWKLLGPDGADFIKLAGLFLKVTEQAPSFEPGWASLLHVESELVRRLQENYRAPLAAHMAQARRLNPDMAAVHLAEAALLPPGDVTGRIRLADKAVAKNPGNAVALMQRSYDWSAVGRMTRSVVDAFEAVQLEPLSPMAHDVHVYALQGAGQFDKARKETDDVARMWPDASQLWFMRLRSTYIYGNPDEAWALVQAAPSWTDKLVEDERKAFLEARKNPSERNIAIAVEKARAVVRKWGSEYADGVFYDWATLAVFGRTEEMFTTMDRLNERPDAAPFLREAIFRPMFRDFWRDPRSMRVAKQLGVLEYWRKSGNWPDFCYEPDHPYDCKAEAAKLTPGSKQQA